jgi:TPR repeat protein
LMMLGRTEEAKAVYLAHKGEALQGKTWEMVVADDFAKLRAAGITHPLMGDIEKEFAASGQGSGTRSVAPSLAATPIRQTEEPTPAPDPDVEAVNRYSSAAARGDADAQLKLGNMYGAGRGGLDTDPREAARLYKLSADQGNADAQLQLAYMYENGDVLPKDWREAARLYRLSADQGNAAAQANLADFYERGDAGLRKDLCEAMRLRKLAAAQGNSYAQKNLNAMRVARCKL